MRITYHVLRITYYLGMLVILAACAPTPRPTPPAPLPTADLPEMAERPAPRLGVSAALGRGLVLCDGREWQMAWSPSWYYSRDCLAVQHVPMLSSGPHRWEPARALDALARKPHSYWLVFNECENQHQCNTKPEAAAVFYHDVILPWVSLNDPAARLIVGGANAGDCGIAWLERFVTYYREQYGEDVPRAGWHAHVYSDLWAGTDCQEPWQWDWARTQSSDAILNGWLDQAENFKQFALRYGREGDEWWISETSCLAPPPAACHTSTAALAQAIVNYLNADGRWITRAAWYADFDNHWWRWTRLYSVPPVDGQEAVLTPAGEIWLKAELEPAVPLELHHIHFPIVGYAAEVIPQPRPTPAPGGYP